CASTTSTSKHGGADQAPTQAIARLPSGVSISNGRPIRTPSPTTPEATACIRRSPPIAPCHRPRSLRPTRANPMIEKRFEQIKTVHEIAPVLLKNEGRIEALFTLYFLALLVQAIIERELRLAMKRENINELPLYP